MFALDLLIYADNQHHQDTEARELMSTLATMYQEPSLLREWLPLATAAPGGHSATPEPSEAAQDVTDTGWDVIEDPERGADYSAATWSPPTDQDFAFLGIAMDRNRRVTISGDGTIDLGGEEGEQDALAALFAEVSQDREWV